MMSHHWRVRISERSQSNSSTIFGRVWSFSWRQGLSEEVLGVTKFLEV